MSKIIANMNEQEVYDQISDKIEELTIRRNLLSAHKLSGDICVRMLASLINQHLEETHATCKLSDVSAFILGLKTEFDLLIVDRDAKPITNTNCYIAENVRGVIEVKMSGLFGGDKNGELDKAIGSIKATFDTVQKKCNLAVEHCIYFTLEERARPKKPTAINFLGRTEKGLNPFPVICMLDNAENKAIAGQWSNFIQLLPR